MHSIFLTVVPFLLGHVVANPLMVHPGGAKEVQINAADTLNATNTLPPTQNLTASMINNVHLDLAATTTSTNSLTLSLYNNLDSSTVNAYVTGLDSNGVLVMLLPDGSWYYPSSTSSNVPEEITENVAIPLGKLGTTTNVTLPGYLSSGRVWFADGVLVFYSINGWDGPGLVEPSVINPSDASAAVNWGFVELTYGDNSIYVNLSYVDFVGLPIGMELYGSDGAIQTALGVDSDAVRKICAGLVAQAAIDGQPWDQLCVFTTSGDVIRVLSPTDYLSIVDSAWTEYWTAYIDDVWNHYSDTPLTIDTQSEYGHVDCTTDVASGTMSCSQDDRLYEKPSAVDIFGCDSGPFAILSSDNWVHQTVVPRLCAAFHRSTFLLPGGNVQPSLEVNSFYNGSPTNWYSKLVHDFEADGKGYAFPYDDVTPSDGTNQSGLLSNSDPILLALTIGGPSTTAVTTSSASPTTSSTTSRSTTSEPTTPSTLAKASNTQSRSSPSGTAKTISTATAPLASPTWSPHRVSATQSTTKSPSIPFTTSTHASTSSVRSDLRSTLLLPISRTMTHA